MPAHDSGEDPRAISGATVRAARERAGLTQEALGHRVGFDPIEINRIDRGRRNVGLLTTIKLAKALDIAPGDLLAGT